MELNEIHIQKLIKFFKDYLPQVPQERLEWVLRKHIEYKTCYALFDTEDEPIAFVRWNIIDGGREAYCMDMVLRKDYQRMGLVKQLIKKGVEMYPTVERITFERQRKINKKPRTYRVSQLLRR